MRTEKKEVINVEIWYFSPDYNKVIDEEIKDTLESIKNKWGIKFNVKAADDRDSQERYYKDFFSPPRKAYLLRQRTGKSVEKDLKSRNGKGKPMLRGVIALSENDNIQYYIKPGRSGEDALKFLKDILKDPKGTIKECYEKVGEITDEEMAILEAFKAKQIINGSFKTYISVGYFFREKFECNLRFIDAICEEENGSVWILEIERELNFTAIGQA
ncbi:unnamed protein product, partial [marine sediment metagenome]